MPIRRLVLLLSVFIVISCGTSSSDNMDELSLLQYGVPFSIKAPADATVKKSDLGVFDDVTIKAGTDFSIQLLASEATELDPTKVKDGLLEGVQRNPYFAEVLEEDPAGFIYRKEIDSSNVNYSFRYVRIQGDREYIFQPSLVGQFSLDDVKAMYSAVEKK